ncbi:hypothetical protein [Aquisalinus flavus]|uniref:Uncharacterized protein n=1 Tax=Aquisalinus flavus TaxID=1526572 RepID=A0A8J2V1Z7_9PROT|nr:hypothetical protein [Aquisalinus flavus]MBD0426914.1 hypothetical protein [Aquisalinus flavus]UNE46757.1 hypothetical protein FF099_01105 [Aquisalinus flavus]GGC96942.1 hypothetical protein GCM10011342_02270 [Aquisalinus flavus]
MNILKILLIIAVVLAATVAAILFSGREVPVVAEQAVEEVQETAEDIGEAVTGEDEPAPAAGEQAVVDDEDPTGVEQAVAEEFPLGDMVNEAAATAITRAREAVILADRAGDDANKAISNIAMMLETDPVAAAKDSDRLAVTAMESAEASSQAAQAALVAAREATETAETMTNEYRAQAMAEAKEARDAADEAVAAALDAESYAREAMTAASEADAAAQNVMLPAKTEPEAEPEPEADAPLSDPAEENADPQ